MVDCPPVRSHPTRGTHSPKIHSFEGVTSTLLRVGCLTRWPPVSTQMCKEEPLWTSNGSTPSSNASPAPHAVRCSPVSSEGSPLSSACTRLMPGRRGTRRATTRSAFAPAPLKAVPRAPPEDRALPMGSAVLVRSVSTAPAHRRAKAKARAVAVRRGRPAATAHASLLA
jgi:hypothetical protein